MEYEIRKARSADFNAVHKLIKEFAVFIKTPEKVSITLEQMEADKEVFNCPIAISEGEVIGFASFFYAYYSWSGKAIYLDDLYVRPDYRGEGIGNAMFEEVKALGVDKGCYKMKWQVSKWNDNAQEFYRSKGAVIEDTEINCELKL